MPNAQQDFRRYSGRMDEPEIAELSDNDLRSNRGMNYKPTDAAQRAVDIALGLGRPLLISGEPGCGKTELGYHVARKLLIGRVYSFVCKSTTDATSLLYEYDSLRRLRDSQVRAARLTAAGRSADPRDYITYTALGRGILDGFGRNRVSHLLPARFREQVAPESTPSVVIIDEIDKAPRDVCNDLLYEFERMSFKVPELFDPARADAGQIPGADDQGQRIKPIVFITSNGETQLPDAFLRRCAYLHMDFPGPEMLRTILNLKRNADARLGINDEAAGHLLKFFELLRSKNPEKKPGVAELIDAAHVMAGFAHVTELKERVRVAAHGLIKLKSDMPLLDKCIEEIFRTPTASAARS